MFRLRVFESDTIALNYISNSFCLKIPQNHVIANLKLRKLYNLSISCVGATAGLQELQTVLNQVFVLHVITFK